MRKFQSRSVEEAEYTRPPVNVAEFLRKAARTHGQRRALSQGVRSYTYAELDDWVGRVAGGLLQLGMQPGERLALWSQNRPELVVSLFAAFRAGLVVVPINAQLRPSEVNYIVDNAQASALVVDSALVARHPGLAH